MSKLQFILLTAVLVGLWLLYMANFGTGKVGMLVP